MGGRLNAEDSSALSSFDAPVLETVAADFVVSVDAPLAKNYSFEHLDGFPSLTSVGGDLLIYDNESLELFSLPALTTVDGSFWLGDYATASGTEVTDLDGLAALRTIGGSLVIAGNIWLTDISGLGGLQSIGADLLIRYNSKLVDLSALSGLTAVPGDLHVGHVFGPGIPNYSIGSQQTQTSLAGLENIETIGGDLDVGDIDVSDFSELASLTSVGGSLLVEEMGSSFSALTAPPLLSSLGGLRVSETNHLESIFIDVTSIAGDIEIYDGFRLRTLHFPDLETLGGRLYVERMESSTSYGSVGMAFPSLLTAGEIDLADAGATSSLDGFPKLESVGADLRVTMKNSAVTATLRDFEKLQTVGGDVVLYTTNVSTLEGFDALTTVAGELSWTGYHSYYPEYSWDDTLTTVTAFGGLSSVASLEIGGFKYIPKCWAENLVDQIWPSGGAVANIWVTPDCP